MARLRDFFSQPHTRGKGRIGEDRAVAWLKHRGYRIVARNVSNAGGEIDVVARDGDTLCFVEIKARADAAFGGAVAAVDWKKRKRIERAARAYLAKHPWDGPCRFDVVGLDLSESPETGERGSRVTLIQNAFQAGE